MPFTCTRHSWQTPDGLTWSYSLWEAIPGTVSPRAVVIGVHGLGGAALDYEPLATRLLAHGFITYALELRGQGNDPRPGQRGDLLRIDDWFADLHAFFALVRLFHPGLPVYAYGESMGAVLLTRFLAQAPAIDQPAGLVLASPVVVLPSRPNRWLFRALRLFVWLMPGYRVDVRAFARQRSGEAPRWVTRDEAHRRWIETAPHKLHRFSLRFFRHLHDLIDGCLEAAPHLHVPVLVLYAGHDVFITPERVESFYARLGSSDKESQFFPDAYHLLLHDHDQEAVLQCIEAWLLRRLDGLIG